MTIQLSRADMIEQSAAHVRQLLADDSSGHDWWHIERVRRNALQIGRGEGADLFVVELASLLHDIADWKFHGGDDALGPQRADAWLSGLGVKITLTPCKHWGARTLSDHHRGYGGFVLEHQGRKIYHAGDSAYFEGFKEIGQRCAPEIALLPIGAYHPEGLRNVHMGPEDAIQVFRDLGARWLIPMHYGTFRLSFEDMDEPPRRLRELARRAGLVAQLRILEEGVPRVF